MNKTIITIVSMMVGTTIFAQVGINTTSPHATLDVAKNLIEPTSAKDGIIPPKISKNELANKDTSTYTATQTGAIVFVNSIATPTGTLESVSQVDNINKIGFYYFDGTINKWNYLDTNTNPGNIYLNDGILPGKRTLNQGNNKLIFTDTFIEPNSSADSTTLLNTDNNSITLGASSETDVYPSLVLNPVARRTGINIDKPKATLEIHPSIYSNTKIEDGIIIPRLSKEEINRKMSDSSNPYKISAVTDFAGLRTSHVGTLLYIFNTSDVTLSPVHTSLTNASTDGFYYLDENRVWQKSLNTANTNTLIIANADTSKDAWVDNSTNTRVELGTNSGGTARTTGTQISFQDDGKLNMGANGSADAGIHLVGDGDNSKDDIRLDSYSGTATANPGPNFRMYASRGTQAAPENLTTDNSLGQINFHGRIGSNFTASSRIWADYKGNGTTNLSNLSFSVNGYGNPSLVINSSQNVGIGTSSPTVNLEIKGNPTEATSLDGVIPPKVTGNQLKAKTYTASQDGAIVYVTAEATNSVDADQTTNVNMPRLYHFDGPSLKWIYLGSNSIMTNFRSNVSQALSTTLYTDQLITFTSGNSTVNLATDFNDTDDTFKIKHDGYYQISGFVGFNANQTSLEALQFVAVNLKIKVNNIDATGIRSVFPGILAGTGTAIQVPTTILKLKKNDIITFVIQRPDIIIGAQSNQEFGSFSAGNGHINLPNGQSYSKSLTIMKVR